MDEKVLQFEKNHEIYCKKAVERAENGDYEGALRFLFCAKSLSDSIDVLADIADVYADMGQLELSNKYWFYYMDRAPKDKLGVAYEELAINYFYMDDFLSSSYYFHLKLTTDGFISQENLDKEIVDFFSGEEFRRNSYHIAYPFDRADYSYQKKKGKRAIASGGFTEAVKIIESIPVECRDEDTSGELAVSYFMSDDLESAEKVARESIKNHGENVTAYCNLSTVFDMKEDFEKSDFYYRKALSLRTGEKSEVFKIATCAIERADHETARECLEKILVERPYDIAMRFFYGMALLNLNNPDGAVREFERAHRISPTDIAVKYYLNYAKKVSENGEDAENILPLKYVKDLPEKIKKKYAKKIKALADSPEKIYSAMKKQENKDIAEWGLHSTESEIMRQSVYLFATAFTSNAKKALYDALLNPETTEECKRVITYVLLAKGHKEKFGVVGGSYYLKIKPKKLVSEKDSEEGFIYLSAYALALSRVMFRQTEGLEKIAQSIDKVYRKFKGVLTLSDVTNEEIAGVAVSECGFKYFDSDKKIIKLFEISKDKLDKLKAIVKGEKNA